MPIPTVSIILPTYNRADIINRAIESVLKQTVSNWELIIVDDGSADNTIERVQKYLADKRINYHSESHWGVVATINRGIALASADIGTILGSDDWYKPDHLEVNLEYLSHHPEIDIVHSNSEAIGDRLVLDITRPGEFIDLDECYHEGTLFIRQRVLRRFTFDGENQPGEGYRLVHKALAAGFKVHKPPSRTYVYDRTRPDSLTKQATKAARLPVNLK